MSRLEETVNDAELIFECIPEDLDKKKDLFESMSHFKDRHNVSILPSETHIIVSKIVSL